MPFNTSKRVTVVHVSSELLKNNKTASVLDTK